MANLEAEMARFEAEMASVQQQTVASYPPQPAAYASLPTPSVDIARQPVMTQVNPALYQTSPSPYAASLHPGLLAPTPAYAGTSAYDNYESTYVPQAAHGPSQTYYAAPAQPATVVPDPTPASGAAGTSAAAKGIGDKKVDPKNSKGMLRTAAGKKWRDPTLTEWPDNDYRIFVGDMGNEVNDDLLAKAFSKYPSFAKAKIVRDKRTNKSKGYGFVSFLDAGDYAKALREMQGKYIGNRPCKLRKSSWEERSGHQGKRKGEHKGGGGGKKQK